GREGPEAEGGLGEGEFVYPLAYALVMAAVSWEQVDRRGWRAPAALCAQAGRLMAAWRVSAELVDDAGAVASALDWAVGAPALLERDDQGRYRPVFAGV